MSASLKILVVDDESDLREMLTRSFSREGHQVTAVASGREAIDRASDEHFDIVLLDIALGPGPDGYEVCRTLRARRNVVPIIMLTALDSEADAVLGLEAGGDDYVTKPFGLAELRSRIRAVLRRTGARAGSLGNDVLSVGPITLDRSRREVSFAGHAVKLTFSEFELLDALMADPGRLLNRQEPAARDLGRLRLPRPARDRRPHPPPAGEARARAGQAAVHPDRARRWLPTRHRVSPRCCWRGCAGVSSVYAAASSAP